mgnify:CR=1 FL=1
MEKSTAHKFDNVAKIYNTPIFQLYYLWAHRVCISFLKNYIEDGFKILDVACGTGIFLEKISKERKNLQLFGIDNSEKMIAIADKYPGVANFKIASAEKIPFEDNSFDLVTIIDAFYYFQDKEAVLKECFRVLKPNQYLFLFYIGADLFPKFLMKEIKIASRLLLYNTEKYSTFISINKLKKITNTTNFSLAVKKMIIMHRFILLKKGRI